MASRLSIALGGDLSLARSVEAGVGRFGSAWLFDQLAPTLRCVDLFTFNWESPLLPKGRPLPDKGLVVADAESLDGLFDGMPPAVATLANNHVLDAGPEGVEATRRVLTRQGVTVVGAGVTEAEAGAPVFVDTTNGRVGFLGRAENCPQLSGKGYPGPACLAWPEIVNRTRAAAYDCDALVVHLHHGVEFVDWPAPHFVALCRDLADAGATLVIGGHPHVPQGHERRGRSRIFYCLGNLAFDIADDSYQGCGSPWTRRAALAVVEVDDGTAGEPRFFPYRLEAPGRPLPLAGSESNAVIEHIAALSAGLSDGEALKRHWRETALRYLGIYLGWAAATRDEQGHATERTIAFCERLAMDESRMWVRELFGDADWPDRISRAPWT